MSLCAHVHTTTAYHPRNDLHTRRIPEGATPWDSGFLVHPGEQFAVTLTVPGVYDYYCMPHEAAGRVGRCAPSGLCTGADGLGNMAGDAVPYDHLPFFYSDLFDVGYEAVGDLDAQLDTVADWREPYREGVIYYLQTGRVRGVLLWNVWGQVEAARELIKARGPFTAADLKGRLPA